MELKESLERVLKGQKGLQDLKVREIKESACTKPGDNYMSVVSAVEVDATLPGGSTYKTSVFVKRPVANVERLDVFPIEDAFSNEGIMYNEVLPMFEVPVACARSYHAGRDMVVLEDLRSSGYTMADKQAGLDLAKTTLVLQALAEFHAASYQAIMTKGEDFTRTISALKPLGDMMVGPAVENSLSTTIKGTKHTQNLQAALTFLKSLQGRASETLARLKKPRDITVLCHGDFWINNILLRAEQEDAVRIVDLQACFLGSPAVDVWSFLYSSTQPSVADHTDLLVQSYCTSFVNSLAACKLSPDLIPPPSKLKEDILARELYGFLLATMYLPVLDTAFDLDNKSKEQLYSDDFLDQHVSPMLQVRLDNLIKVCLSRGVFSK